MTNDSIEASNTPRSQSYDRSTLEILIDTVYLFRYYIFVLLAIGAVAVWFFNITIPDIEFWHIYVASISALGVPIGLLIWGRIESDIDQDVRLIDIAPLGNEVKDRVEIPEERWTEFEVAEGRMPSGRTLTGKTVHIVRAIDFENDIAYPADDFPDEHDYPSYYDIIASGEDVSAYVKARDYLLEKAKKFSQMNVDDEVIREDARGDAVMMYAKGLQNGRNGEIDIEREPDPETVLEAQQAIRESQGEKVDGNEGDEQ